MTGKVYLIGAGCGEADLITLKGLKKLLESDVVLYDSLVDEELINKLSENVEKIYVGKRYHQKSMPQDEINDLIIKYAKSGKIVTRLKGGDPYVFGRGSEEAQAIEKENISYEVIPGISSAIAVPELAGIPLTHRQLSRNFTVLTASSVGIDNKENITPIDYQALTKIGGTIVFLMGYHHIPEIMNNFLNSGMNKNTPCAIISKGCTKEQKVIKGNIKNISSEIEKQNIQAPVIIVIGECVNLDLKGKLSENSNYKNDIKDLKIAVTGTDSFVKKLSEKIKSKKWKSFDWGFLDVINNNEKLPDFNNFDWLVFTSQNGIEQFFEKLKKEHKDIRLLSDLKIAVIGSGTAEKLLEYGIYADLMPNHFDSETLTEELLARLQKNDKILICRAKEGSDFLINKLNENGYEYTDFHIYELKENLEKKTILSTLKINSFDVDYLVFGSAKGVTTFFDSFENSLNKDIKIVCIGEKCAQAIKKYKAEKVLIADKYNIDGIIECIEKDFNKD